jgi:cholesterol transport system auxiliary component
MNALRIKLAAAALAAALAGCAGTPDATYDLSAPSSARLTGAQRGVMVVLEPVAVAVIDGQRIVVKPNDGEVTYLPKSQWADRAPKLVQAKIIEALENAGRLKSVGRPGDRLTADYQLVTELRSFEVRAATTEAAVEITAKIVDDRSGRIVAGEVFRGSQPLGASINGPAATKAIDAALAQALSRLVAWTGQRL